MSGGPVVPDPQPLAGPLVGGWTVVDVDDLADRMLARLAGAGEGPLIGPPPAGSWDDAGVAGDDRGLIG